MHGQLDEVSAAGAEWAADAARLRLALEAAEQPVVVTVEGLDSLSDAQVLRAAQQRAVATARVFERSHYEGDAGEVVDLTEVFRSDFAGRVRVAAARVFLSVE